VQRVPTELAKTLDKDLIRSYVQYVQPPLKSLISTVFNTPKGLRCTLLFCFILYFLDFHTVLFSLTVSFLFDENLKNGIDR
jgi:hypothetical protein